MPFQLYFSNRIEELRLRLNQNRNSLTFNPFLSDPVWTPNQNVHRWLQIKTAEEFGICANLPFQHLEGGLWNLLNQEFFQNRYKEITSKVLEGWIHGILLSPDLKSSQDFSIEG